jgi:hypothetical protein
MGRRVRSAWCNVCRDALRCRGQRSSRAFARAPDLPGFFGPIEARKLPLQGRPELTRRRAVPTATYRAAA